MSRKEFLSMLNARTGLDVGWLAATYREARMACAIPTAGSRGNHAGPISSELAEGFLIYLLTAIAVGRQRRADLVAEPRGVSIEREGGLLRVVVGVMGKGIVNLAEMDISFLSDLQTDEKQQGAAA